jgi:photosystem II stability/assembly factor-like uncharacterized protein
LHPSFAQQPTQNLQKQSIFAAVFSNLFRMTKPILFVIALVGLFTPCINAQNTPNEWFKPLKWRNIGPFRGGRSVCATGITSDPSTYYMGTTGGGLWKTTDRGITWGNCSDGFFKTGSVGAIAVADSDPNVVYVGMGEHAIRGVMTHHGDGMYKSTDAGRTWQPIGLAQSQHIARIVVHPTDPNTLWVAVQGTLYSPSKQRGIFKSTDGGQSWQQVLFVNEQTGCAELSIDATNPRILYAAMWEHGRRPWQVISGGAGSGLYKSVDGGLNWERLSEGLPKEMGKMSIAVCPSNAQKVYALIESDSDKEAGGLFVSTDAGKNWSRITNDHRLVQRAWYYIELFVDPKNEHTVYVLSAPALRSLDGGKSWEDISGAHGDYHDMWINPHNPDNLILADDGGAAITFNACKTWSSLDFPTAQFYRINVDNQFPYRIYGGQQDNSSVSIAHRSFGSHITERNWTASAGGESAFLAFNPDNPRYVMGGSYQGTIDVLDTYSGASTNVMSAPIQYLGRDAKDMKYRYNWNAPIICSPHDPSVFYHGAQVLLKTTDMGKNWQEVSPDLTRNDKSKQGKPGVPYTNEAVGAENYGTLSYVVESPREKGVIWTGSDDGLVHLSTDGGLKWNNVTPAGLEECLINSIELSPFDKGTAYIATTRYKFNDHRPGLYKTTNYGKSWVSINNGLPANAFTRVVREDPSRRDLLFAGTELGLFVSWNGGANWEAFQLNLPVTPITDLKIHQGDLIAATSGRSFWILDDLNVLHQFSPNPKFGLFSPEKKHLATGSSELDESNDDFRGMHPHEGVNPANGIVLYYYLPDANDKQALTLTIKDANGRVIRQFSSVKDSTQSAWEGGPSLQPVLSAKKGLNRLVWDLRHATLPGVPDTYFENSFDGHKAIPGVYTVSLQRGSEQSNVQAEILANPLYNVTPAAYAEYDRIMSDMEAKVSDMHLMINDLYKKSARVTALLEDLPDREKYAAVRQSAEALSAKMKAWDEDMVQRKSKAYDDVENFPNKFSAEYMFLLNQTESDIPQVNRGSLDIKALLDPQWEALRKRGVELSERDIPALNQLLWSVGVGRI